MNPPGSLDIRRHQILEALRGRPDGATRQELQALARLQDLDEQAVRRLLAQLVERGAVRVTGQTKARQYFLAQAGPAAGSGDGPPLSPEGRASRALLARPQLQRPPASYQRAFLEAYQPGVSSYLPRSVRERLGGHGPDGHSGPARQRLLVDLAWDSIRLEGGNWSRAEAQRLMEQGETPAGRAPHEAQMLLNHKAAVEFLLDPGQEVAVDPTTVRNLSALLTENLLADPTDEGRLRARACAVPGSAYRPSAVPEIIQEDFRLILDRARGIADPFEQSFFLLVHLSYLHPFGCANGATARLAAQLPLLARNNAPALFLAVPAGLYSEGLLAVWEQNDVALLRDLFVFACERCAPEPAPGRPDPFRLRYRDDIKAAVRAVVLAGETAAEADRRVRAQAQATLPREARAGFLAAVEAELASLHDGNFARYRLRPSEYAAWKARR